MLRTIPPLAALALIAACGPVAEESDDPGRTPSPTPAAVTTAAPPPGPAATSAGDRPQAFAQCAVCHWVEPGAKSIGPSLAGVFGAKAGHVGDFAYSAAMRQSGLTWDEPTLDAYLEAPLTVVPGTKMAFPGLKDSAQRQAVIAYLKTL